MLDRRPCLRPFWASVSVSQKINDRVADQPPGMTMALAETAADRSWSSHGLPPEKALRAWQDWACEALTPMDVAALDADRFAARWAGHGMGPLHLLELTAAPQRVAHPREERAPRGPRFQLVYCQDTPIRARIGPKRFDLMAGEFVLLDNTQAYEMRMDSANTSIDLIMPEAWLERWLPDPVQYAGTPYTASSGWGAPLGSLLSTLSREIENAALPRTVIADQLGALLALAVGCKPRVASRHKTKLADRLLNAICERHSDPELDADAVAREAGISKRYLHAVLAEAGTTFITTLAGARLDHAGELLSDPRCDGLHVAEISWRCGYLDPSYFTRAFRRRFGMSPSEWRSNRRR